MVSSQAYLLKSKRFLPLFLTQFMVAFNDNFFRTALVTLISYKAYYLSEDSKVFMVTLAIGLFMLPYFLFSTTGGQLATKYNKAKLIRGVKILEVFVMSLGAVGFMLEDIYFLMGVLFLMGAQSALFGPVKYSILPDHLSESELIGANGYVEAGTFLSILLGTIFGSIVILTGQNNIMTASVLVILFAVIGYITSLFIPDTVATHPERKFNYNIVKETKQIFGLARKDMLIYDSIVAISWVWMIGAVFLGQMTNITTSIINDDGNASFTILTFFLALFSLGIGIGSIFCNYLLKGEISTKYVPISAVLMTIFMADFTYTIDHHTTSAVPVVLANFIQTFDGWRMIVDLFFIAVLAGIYIVPLYAFIQYQTDEKERSQIIAANNILNAVFMVLSSIFAMIILSLTASSIIAVFFVLTVTHALMSAWLFYRIN